jgi:hypothetical protein
MTRNSGLPAGKWHGGTTMKAAVTCRVAVSRQCEGARAQAPVADTIQNHMDQFPARKGHFLLSFSVTEPEPC